ncbi:MAG: hypothetical protein H3C50_06280, partial [Kiritimatiellae bacterium]|nr:hypothetical protein [Kiritimatiellia bacterium]
ESSLNHNYPAGSVFRGHRISRWLRFPGPPQGGMVLLTTPSTWRQIFTPRENWLGGYEGEHGPVRTLDGLRELLEPTFVLERRVDLPFLIREHARKFELVIAEGTAWRKR